MLRVAGTRRPSPRPCQRGGAGEQKGKMLALIPSQLVRGECIDDADVLCAGGRTVRFTLTLARAVKGVDKTYQWGGAKVYHQRGHWPA